MIVYTEKGPGLHNAIRAAGHALREENGVWISSNDKAVQVIIDGYTLAQAQALKKADVSAHAAALRNQAVGGYSPGELASWSIKLAEARAYRAQGEGAEVPLLAMEAQLRGASLPDLVERVLTNGAMFSTLEAVVAGHEGYHRDRIEACKTFDEVVSYDFSAGWPEV